MLNDSADAGILMLHMIMEEVARALRVNDGECRVVKG